MINRYTVIGQPIAHSLSPEVHHLFGELTQRKIYYTRTETTPEQFEKTVLDWQASGAKGCNVTSPFKQQALAVCHRVSINAQRAGSVNTIHMHRDGNLVGHNTDGAGLVADIVGNNQVALRDKRVLVLGAGGASRGIIGPLLLQNTKLVHVANRTAEKAIQLSAIFKDLGLVSGSGYDALDSMDEFDVVINATTLGLSGEMPELPDDLMCDGALAYDMTYATDETVFMSWAAERSARTLGGLGMLVEQAAESFLIWEDARPKTRLIYPKLAEILADRQ